MEILFQLGANWTAFVQFVVFILTITFLTTYVFGPYFKAYDQRLNQTKGADQVAMETQEEVIKLGSIYQTKAREINQKIQQVFESSRADASGTANSILNDVKTKAAEQVEAARKQIQNQRASAEGDLARVSNDIAQEISNKISGAV